MDFIKYEKYDNEKKSREILIPISCNFLALHKFRKATGVEYTEVNKVMDDIDLIKKLFWFAAETGAKILHEDLQIVEDDVDYILDASYSEFIEMYVNSVMKTVTPLMNTMKAIAGEEIKKN